MSGEQKKPATPPATGPPPASPQVQAQPQKLPQPVKNPLISRRAFVLGALGASVLLTIGSLSQSGQILGPLIPPAEQAATVALWTDLEAKYQAAVASNNLYAPSNYSQFFYWPYDSSASPYYKNIVVRIPDEVQPTPQSSFVTAPNPKRSRFAAYNTTCVHLRCLVNPGYAGNPPTGEFRLQCPCHGSQYRLNDGVPVAGPAFDLGLNPLPQIQLTTDSSGNIRATAINGTVGIGRTS